MGLVFIGLVWWITGSFWKAILIFVLALFLINRSEEE